MHLRKRAMATAVTAVAAILLASTQATALEGPDTVADVATTIAEVAPDLGATAAPQELATGDLVADLAGGVTATIPSDADGVISLDE